MARFLPNTELLLQTVKIHRRYVKDYYVHYIDAATEHHCRVLHCFEIKKKRHEETHFEVKIVHMYKSVSRKNTKKSFLYSVVFLERGLTVAQGTMHACTVYVK